jgi:ComF family protein
MFDKLLAPFSPHICKSCGAVGAALCERCIFDILDKKFNRCVICDNVVKGQNLCPTCGRQQPFAHVFVVGERSGALRRLVGDFKYNSERAAAATIAELLHQTLPELPPETVIVPVPTIAPHVRQRGFDHTRLVAHRLAKLRGLRLDGRLLMRRDNSVQHGLNAQARRVQAAQTFAVNNRRPVPHRVLLFDDIFTTGATTAAAAQLLKKAGVKTVDLAIVARQRRDA